MENNEEVILTITLECMKKKFVFMDSVKKSKMQDRIVSESAK